MLNDDVKKIDQNAVKCGYTVVTAAHLWGIQRNERLASHSKNHVPPEANRKRVPNVLCKAMQMSAPYKLQKELPGMDGDILIFSSEYNNN